MMIDFSAQCTSLLKVEALNDQELKCVLGRKHRGYHFNPGNVQSGGAVHWKSSAPKARRLKDNEIWSKTDP